jgi:hypothetical protein
MPTRTNPSWTYDDFVNQADERVIPVTAQRTRRTNGTPFPSDSLALNGLRALIDAERAVRCNVTLDDGTYLTRQTDYRFSDYMAKRKGLYQFIKDAPPRVDRGAMIRAYTAMRALRLPSASISRAARQYGAGDLSREACLTVKNFREDYQRAQHNLPRGYTVVRYFEDRRIEFHLSALPGPMENGSLRTRKEQWEEISSLFRNAIRRAREERRHLRVDPLANKPTNFHMQKNALKLLRVYKQPDENVRSVGIEIECYIPATADMTKFWSVAPYVNVGSDGSIHPEGRDMRGVEFRVCAPAYKMAEVITTLCGVLKDVGAKVNASCGLHVHLDQRNRTAEEVKQTFTNFIRAQNLLFEVVPKSRRDNTYCKKHRGTDFEQAARGGRYKAINAVSFRKHRTIEIRLFNGTVNASKIINWVKTLWAIEAGQPVLRCPKTFDIAQRYWRIEPETLNWLKGRQEKFKDVPADNTDVMDVDAEPIEEN